MTLADHMRAAAERAIGAVTPAHTVLWYEASESVDGNGSRTVSYPDQPSSSLEQARIIPTASRVDSNAGRPIPEHDAELVAIGKHAFKNRDRFGLDGLPPAFEAVEDGIDQGLLGAVTSVRLKGVS